MERVHGTIAIATACTLSVATNEEVHNFTSYYTVQNAKSLQMNLAEL